MKYFFNVVVALFISTGWLFGQQSTPSTKSIKDFLNPDGTPNLKTGFRGGVNVDGYKMVLGKNGAPRFLQTNNAPNSQFVVTSDDNDYWDGNFSNPVVGVGWEVFAFAAIGDTVYVGGWFQTVEGVSRNYIAKWNGSSWSSLGSGTNGYVTALAVKGSDLYAGGIFTTAGGVTVNHIAKWNGSSWSALGSGVDDLVNALCFIGDTLYAGGDFNNAGGSSAKRIAKWNGSNWSALGSGIYTFPLLSTGGSVSALAALGNDLYVGGGFDRVDGMTINNIAKWNHSSWSALGTGTNGPVAALTVLLSTKLYVGGQFSNAGGVAVNNLAVWNGSWYTIGTGTNGPIWTLKTYGNDYVLVGGDFTSAGGNSANYFAAIYDDGYPGWQTYGSGLNAKIWAIGVDSGDIYIGGVFTVAGGYTVNRIAYSPFGNNWQPVNPEMNGIVRAAVISGSDLYIAGEFTKLPGDISANRIAKWNGSSWSALGSGLDNSAYALAVNGSTLYAAGIFTMAGGGSANSIAQWNGSTWSALGTGMDNGVLSLAVIGSDLYAGGWFGTAGGTSANYIARWNGTSWSALGSGMDGGVNALTSIGSDLYAGGDFVTAGGSSANYIARWNGSSWSALGSGMDYSVFALAVIGTDLFAGGNFTTAGGTSANNIAQWNGSSWSALGSGTNGTIYSLAVSGDQLFAGGLFTTAGSASANAIAKWDGSGWTQLGSGLVGTSQSIAYALAANGDNLYVGGSFASAGTKMSHYIAHWNAPVAQPTITTSTLSGLTPSMATLSSTVNPQGLTTTLRVLFGTTTGNYTDSLLATQSPLTGLWVPTSVSVNATGLSNNQTYYAKLAATNSRGYKRGNEVSFTTPSPSSVSTVPGTLLSFNGTTQYISVPDDPSLRLTDTLTIEAWMYPTRTNNSVIDKGNYNYLLSVQPNGQSGLGLYNNGTWIYSGGSVPLNEWSHVAVVFQTGANGLKFYRNGVLLGEHTASGALVTNTGQLNIGRQAPGICDCNLFEGKIDEVRMWNVARTAQQIRENMHLTLTGGESGLLAYWQFNENSGTSAGEPVNEHFGLLVNSPAWTASTVPVGSGTSASASGFTSGTSPLGTVTVMTTNAFDNTVDLTATQITTAPNTLPGSSSTELNDRYWVVDAFGTTGSFDLSLAFVVPSSFTNNGGAALSSYNLYRRNTTSDGIWTVAKSGASRIAVDTVVFDGITSLSQFSIGTDDPLPMELVSFTASSHRLNADLKWITSIEVNNHGFEIERRAVGQTFLFDPSSGQAGTLVLRWEAIGFVEGNGTTNAPKEYTFTDKDLSAGKYSYRLKQIDRDGKISYSEEVEVSVGTAPKVFALDQNYPNPFNPTTSISYSMPKAGNVSLRVYDILGKEIASLVNGVVEAGIHTVQLNASTLPSGIYFYTIRTDNFTAIKKMLLIK